MRTRFLTLRTKFLTLRTRFLVPDAEDVRNLVPDA